MRLQYKTVNKFGDIPTHGNKLGGFSSVRSRFRAADVGTTKAISLMAADVIHPNTAFIGGMKDLKMSRIGCPNTALFSAY
jgi:hypothetical protein